MGAFIFMTLLIGGLSVLLLMYGNSSGHYSQTTRHFVAEIVGWLSAVTTFICIIVILITSFDWVASKHKAAIINREYNQNYTREEIFFAEDVIEIIRELDRNRYEINGDLLK